RETKRQPSRVAVFRHLGNVPGRLAALRIVIQHDLAVHLFDGPCRDASARRNFVAVRNSLASAITIPLPAVERTRDGVALDPSAVTQKTTNMRAVAIEP